MKAMAEFAKAAVNLHSHNVHAPLTVICDINHPADRRGGGFDVFADFSGGMANFNHDCGPSWMVGYRFICSLY